jgi:hypothetical protein
MKAEIRMADLIDIMRELERDFENGVVPKSAEELGDQLEPLSIQLRQHVPVLFRDSRMFRISKVRNCKPDSIDKVGAPPPNIAPMGRLNDKGQSVLYLADSPDTAFAERRAELGEFCLSEWRVNVEKLGLANGGISQTTLAQRFPEDIYLGQSPEFIPRECDERILNLFRRIFTLDVRDNTALYRWSIACGMVNGFAVRCDLQNVEEMVNGMMKWTGRYPFAAIAYPSVRTDRTSLNYAFNDRGMRNIKLDHLQWVRREEDGSHVGLDFANTWNQAGVISWQNRPANIQLKSGERGKFTKIAETVWKYETEGGRIPWFA